ncbi:short-chain dehydrogenase [Polycladomyces abyssicola]|uniref:Short-chain dehydrogenase n=1 Tax=Polycladomyces abyssicola TaxID=1125966 RepID=A0A8D5ZL70_9BACL|nr:SDR family oxidoreductase [Polycladomyces abyssicola]BCU80340.1 short-chain dehydrogenase [Polycladomyces abyssicola]
MSQPPTSPRVLITGASGGIGYELAKRFARDGHDLILVARSEDKLRQLAEELSRTHGVKADVVPQDLADPSGPDAVIRSVREQGWNVEILVNNAGFGLYGFFAETDWQKEMDMIQVNITALTHLTKHFLPDMIQRGRGKILNVASTASFQPGPLMAVYYATKAYVLSFSEAIANELKGTGVTVTALCPGPTETGFITRANLEQSKLFRINKVMDPATVAEIGYRGLMRGDRIVIPGLHNWLLAQSVRFLPRKAVTAVVRKISERAE